MAHVPDSTMAHIRRLHPDIADAAFYLIYLVRTAGVPLQITSSLRTDSEQARLVRLGLSGTLKSRHLEGKAFDVDIHGWGRDEVPLWWWNELGALAERIGFRWGGRFSAIRDYGHFESPWL